MAQVLKAGSIYIDLKANAGDLIRGFKSAVSELKNFGKEEDVVTSKTKRLQDSIDDLERRKKTLARQLDITKEKYGENSVQVDRLKNRILNLNDRIDTQKMRMGEVADSSSKMSGAFAQAGSSMGFVANTISVAVGNVIADAFNTATQAVFDFTKATFNSAMETEKQGVAFRVLTGSAEAGRKVMSEINKLAVKTPFDISELRDVTKTMMAYGFEANEVVGITEMLGDITSGTGGDLTLLGRAYGQVRTKGKLYAQELNQFGEQGVAIREELAKSMGMSVTDLMQGMETKKISVEFEQFNEVLKQIYNDKFIGLMGELADTAGGRLQNLGETASLVGQRILGIDTETGEVKVGSFFDTFSTGLEFLLSLLEANEVQIVNFFEGLANGVTDVVNTSVDLGQDIFKGIQDFGNWVRDNQELVVAGLIAIAGGITGYLVKSLILSIPAMIAWATTMWTVTIPAIIATIIAFAPFIIIGALIALLIAGIVVAFLNWGKITDWLSTKWQQFTAWFTNLEWVKKTIAVFTSVWNNVKTVFITVWTAITGFFTGIITEIQRVLGQGIGYTIGYVVGLWLKMVILFWTTVFNVMGMIAKIMWDTLVIIFNFWQSLPGRIFDILVILIKLWGDFSVFLYNTAINAVKAVIRFWQSLPSILKNVVVFLLNAWADFNIFVYRKVEELINWFKGIDWAQLGRDMLNGLMNGLADLARRGKELANNFKQGFKDAMGIQSPSKVMFEAGVNIVEGLDEGIGSETFTIERRIDMMAGSVIDGVSNRESKTARTGGLTINQYGASISTTWIPSYAR
jgi:tape measure domain-containing protein